MTKAGPFVEVERAARGFIELATREKLGDLISVEKQVVAGMNYKLTFVATPDLTEEEQGRVIVTVYFQPWTKTIQVTHVSPPLDGITD